MVLAKTPRPSITSERVMATHSAERLRMVRLCSRTSSWMNLFIAPTSTPAGESGSAAMTVLVKVETLLQHPESFAESDVTLLKTREALWRPPPPPKPTHLSRRVRARPRRPVTHVPTGLAHCSGSYARCSTFQALAASRTTDDESLKPAQTSHVTASIRPKRCRRRRKTQPTHPKIPACNPPSFGAHRNRRRKESGAAASAGAAMQLSPTTQRALHEAMDTLSTSADLDEAGRLRAKEVAVRILVELEVIKEEGNSLIPERRAA